MYKRTLFYWSKLYCNQIEEGDPYTLCKKTITINILNFKYLDTADYHSVFHVCEDTNKEHQLDDMEIHFIELTKFRKRIRDYKSSLNNWLLFIDGGNEEEMEMAKKEDPIIKVAEEARDYIASTAEVKLIYELQQKKIRDDKTNLLGAEQKGMTKGMTKGRIEGKIKGRIEGKIKGKVEGKIKGKIETAKKMFVKGYNIDEICELTGLSEKDFM